MFSFFRRRRDARAASAPASASDASQAGGAQAAAVPPASASPSVAAPVSSQAEAPHVVSGDSSHDAHASEAPASDPPAPPSPPSPPSNDPPPTSADHPPPRGLALDEIARGMQHAAAAANQLLSHQYTAMLDQFFDAREDGLLAPRAVEVALDAEHTMPVPLVALATPRGLALDRMVVHLTVRGDFTEALPAGGPVAGDDQRGRFYVTLAPPSTRKDDQGNAGRRDSEHIDIEMQFVALAPPEAIMRVIDEYTHRLVPRPRHVTGDGAGDGNTGGDSSKASNPTDKEPSDD
ncbi:DUF2589 domain-containing protein [Paraburkholderia flava]|uniref:DUF2589 domain-containing protein n=1 Tax=Paraburkholderia flava TaxID=2547393 RepID=UPI001F0FA84F|nr:DUF2589 domain-containing protein [Paraburkholderia flava]